MLKSISRAAAGAAGEASRQGLLQHQPASWHSNLVLRRASTTLVQLLGNALKIIFFIDFKLRPGKRYRIPAVSPVRRQIKNAKKIPRIFWQTNHSAEVTLSVYVNWN